jgi:hypothetical protein
MAVKALFLAPQIFPDCCVAVATLLLYSHPQWAMAGTADIVGD